MKNVSDKSNKTKASQNKTKVKDAKVVKPKNNVHDEGVRVKEIKVTTVDDFAMEEEEDKKLIVIIAIAILIIMATIVGLLVGCERKENEDPKKPDEDVVKPIEDDIVNDNIIEEEDNDNPVKKVTVKTEPKEEPIVEEINYYSVMFSFADNTVKYLEVEENSLISPFVPKGFTSCEYYKTNELKENFNFKNRINEDTVIYASCKVDNYTIVYDTESKNPTEYNAELGTIELLEPIQLEEPTVSQKLPFLGWYLDQEFTMEVKELTPSILANADENKVINLYARFEKLEILYYNTLGEVIESFDYIPGETKVESEDSFRAVCGNNKLLGWTNTIDSKAIKYSINGDIVDLRNNLELYPVCGSTTVVYTSENASVTMGYTNEDLEEYNLPEPSDVELETPTYYIPVTEASETSKKVVPDEAIEILENEIKLQEAKDKAGSNYTPEVGDNVEEHNKVFMGWIEKEDVVEEATAATDATLDEGTTSETENSLTDKVITEDTVIPEIEVLPEDYVPTKENTELEAVWREQTLEELLTGEYDKVSEEVVETNEETSADEVTDKEAPAEEVTDTTLPEA